MIIRFFLLAALCATLTTQTLDDKLIYGKIPPFSTTYIEQVDSYKTVRIPLEQYNALRQHSLTCIDLRQEEVITAYKLASNFYTYPHHDRAIIFSPTYNKLIELRNIHEKNYAPERPGTMKPPIKNILYYMQWVRTIILHNPDNINSRFIELKLYDNTTLQLQNILSTHILEHLQNNSQTQPLYIPQQLFFVPFPMLNLIGIGTAQQNT